MHRGILIQRTKTENENITLSKTGVSNIPLHTANGDRFDFVDKDWLQACSIPASCGWFQDKACVLPLRRVSLVCWGYHFEKQELLPEQ